MEDTYLDRGRLFPIVCLISIRMTAAPLSSPTWWTLYIILCNHLVTLPLNRRIMSWGARLTADHMLTAALCGGDGCQEDERNQEYTEGSHLRSQSGTPHV